MSRAASKAVDLTPGVVDSKRPASAPASGARLEARTGSRAPPPVETASPRAQQGAPVQCRSRP
jgi:hypothetical protein